MIILVMELMVTIIILVMELVVIAITLVMILEVLAVRIRKWPKKQVLRGCDEMTIMRIVIEITIKTVKITDGLEMNIEKTEKRQRKQK